jgi:2-keto-4-pentenoate hydratase
MTLNLLPTERDRAAGALTADEVRQVLARFLAAWEVAQLARASKGQTMAADIIADLISSQRGYAGAGTICQATRKGCRSACTTPPLPVATGPD